MKENLSSASAKKNSHVNILFIIFRLCSVYFYLQIPSYATRLNCSTIIKSFVYDCIYMMVKLAIEAYLLQASLH